MIDENVCTCIVYKRCEYCEETKHVIERGERDVNLRCYLLKSIYTL